MACKVLVIGNFLESSGWSEECRNLILSLDTIGDVEVVPRNINILNNKAEIPERIKELESRSDKNPDVVIQNVLPHMLEYNSRVKSNLAYCAFESDNFTQAGWQHKINMMHSLLVPSYHNKQTATKSNVRVPIHIVPEAVDITKFEKTYPTHRVREVFKEKFIFYIISEWTTRKNIECAVKAFNLEFHRDEPVELFIKTSPGNTNINQKLEDIKKDLNIYGDMRNYKRESVQAEICNEETICSIHQSCDAYLCTSSAEAWNLPCVDAMGFNSSIIAPAYGGFEDYLTEKNSFKIQGVVDDIWRCNDRPLPDIYNSTEKWFYPTISSTRYCMRQCFEKRDLAKRKIQQAKEDVKKFSFQSVGKILEKVLAK